MSKFIDVSGLRAVEQGLMRIGRTALSAAESLGRMVPALGAITSAATIGGIAKLVSDFSNMAVELTKTGMLLDETPERLSGVAQAMRAVGGNADTAVDALKDLRQTAYDAAVGVNGTAAYAFNRLNVALQSSPGHMRDIIDVQNDMLRAFDKVTDAGDRQTYATKTGTQALLQVWLQYHAVGKTTEQYIADQKAMQTLDAQRKMSLIQMSLAMGQLNAAFYDLGGTIAGVVAPVLTPMLRDLAKWVEAHKDDIAGAIKGIANALVWLGNNMDTVKTAAEAVAGVFVTLWGVRAVSSVLTLVGQVGALNTTLGVTSGLVSSIALGLGSLAGAYKLGRDIQQGKPELPHGETDYSKWLDLGFLGHKLYNAVTGNSDTSQAGKTIPLAPAVPGQPASPAPAARPSPAAGPVLPLPKGTRDDPLYVVPINETGGAGGASFGGVGGFGVGGAGGGGSGGGRPAGRFGGMAPGAGGGSSGSGGPVPPGAEALIKSAEGLSLSRYDDVGHPAIGYGHDITPQEMAQGYIETANGGKVSIGSGNITKEQAEAIFQQDYSTRIQQLTKMAPGFDKLNANQQGAVTSYYYNTGRLPRRFKENLASGDMGAIAESLRTGIATARGQYLPALGKRRADEAALFGSPVQQTSSGGGQQSAPPKSTEEVLAHPQSSRGYPFPVQSGAAAEKLAPTLPANTTNWAGAQPDWVTKKIAERQAQGLSATGAPLQLASGGAINGGVNIDITHKNAPADVSVGATSYGTGLNLGAPRVEHQKFGQI